MWVSRLEVRPHKLISTLNDLFVLSNTQKNYMALIFCEGWLVEYLVTVRKDRLSTAGYIPTAYYGGITLGRLLLPEITHRFGEKRMVLLYSFLCLSLQVAFWKVDNLVANGVFVTCMGFLLGPYFATVSAHSYGCIQNRILWLRTRYQELTFMARAYQSQPSYYLARSMLQH